MENIETFISMAHDVDNSEYDYSEVDNDEASVAKRDTMLDSTATEI